MTGIECTILRGGSSKGIYIQRDALPPADKQPAADAGIRDHRANGTRDHGRLRLSQGVSRSSCG
jgi:hypothetical protein